MGALFLTVESNRSSNCGSQSSAQNIGEGIPDLLMLLVQLTQNKMSQKLTYISDLQCTVLEVKVIPGLGTTIDVILVNGVLHRKSRNCLSLSPSLSLSLSLRI